MFRNGLRGALFGGMSVLALLAGSADACTSILLDAIDGTVIHARTMEFAMDLDSDVIIIPRGYARVGATPDGAPGLAWKAKYASVGANALGQPILVDGVNEMGLAAGLLYFPGSAEYMPYAPADAPRTLAPWQLGSWLLENFATVEEAKAAIAGVVAPDVAFGPMGMSPEVHYTLTDTSGASAVIEYTDGTVTVTDNPLGVLTNSPPFDWHLNNLRNYMGLSIADLAPRRFGPLTLEPTGEGTGMLGLPGDFTPPSRFVRAAAFTQSREPAQTGTDAILQAFHLLNNFDIPRGAARGGKDAHGNVLIDYTDWTSATDLKARVFYFRTFENSAIRSVDLMAADLDAAEIVTISMGGEEAITALAP